jgi:MFS family permease
MPAYFSASYVANLLKAVGGVPVFVGVIGSVRALCEVPMLLYSRKLLKKIGYPATIIVIGVLLLIEQLSYIFCNRVWQVLAFQMLHGSINGLLLGSAVGYVFSLVPPELSATAQSIAASTCYVVSIIGNFVSGWVLDSYGIRMLYKVSAFCLGLAVLLFASSLLIGKLAKIKRYDPAMDETSKSILARLSGETAE